MKRDWDIIRKVLIEVQNLSLTERDQSEYAADGLEADLETSHVFLLYDAGFLTGIRTDTMDGRGVMCPDLTWQGHDLLASIESKPVWDRVKQMATDKGLDLSFETVKLLASKALAQIVGV
ncbi:MAG: DUF2513 domain-containing protein [Pseudoalteromonas distincta]